MSRKIIQISVTSSYRGNIENVISLCDDGTVWVHPDGMGWTRLSDIPQDEFVTYRMAIDPAHEAKPLTDEADF